MDRKYVIFTSKAVAIKLYTLVVLLCLLYSIPVLALNEVTASNINGTSPYITINQDRSPSDIIDLLWIAVKKDDNQTQIAPSNNEQGPNEDPNLIYYRPDFNSSPDELIDLPSSIDTFDKIITLVSDYKKEQEELETILTDKQYFEDNDGDDGFKATGTFKIEIKDSDNKAVKLSDKLDDCVGFYAVTLTTSDSELSTTYGLPNNKNYPSASKTYYVRSLSGGLPHVCWLQPSLEKGYPPYAYTQQEYDDYFNEWPRYKDQTTVWLPTKGFKPAVKHLERTWGNFPTTAADKLYFNVVLSGAKWQDVSYTKSRESQAVGLKLSGKNNILRVEFSGPTFSEKPDDAILDELWDLGFSLKVGDRVIYNFELEYWFFISTDTVKGLKYANQYCQCKGGIAMYPTTRYEATNALYHTEIDEDNKRNHYIRTTETLLGEWGNTINEVYPSDDLGNVMSNMVWTSSRVYDDDYNNLIRKSHKVKPKLRITGDDDDDDDWDDDGWDDDDDDECKGEPRDYDPYYTHFYAFDLNDGSIKKMPKETEGLRVICVSD
ncbi:hypothetical protein [Gilliamella apis]|uniref:hypothetical protein n=1 Tax=Gilliamella apis TaxID=1970738 RepID=UPI002742920B|nr:hypothetical protein [Gilliamella apis]WLT06294.1 hypothetical protein RAM11_10585 [Gilliamella apis]